MNGVSVSTNDSVKTQKGSVFKEDSGKTHSQNGGKMARVQAHHGAAKATAPCGLMAS